MERKNDQVRDQYKQALLELIGGRVVAYYPMLARRIGGVKAAVMLSQLLYWMGDKTVRERDGHWIYKSVEQMEEETGLTTLEQQTARKVLTRYGIINAELRGVPRIWRYQVLMDRLAEILLSIGEHHHSAGIPLNGKPIEWETHSMGNPHNIVEETHTTLCGKPTQLNRNIEITESILPTQITTTTTRPAPQDTAMPQLAPPELVVVVWDAAAARLRDIGIWEDRISDYITMAQASGWDEPGLIGLVDRLIEQEGRERACRLLKYRITHETPRLSGYTQSLSESMLICPTCHSRPCLCEDSDDLEDGL